MEHSNVMQKISDLELSLSENKLDVEDRCDLIEMYLRHSREWTKAVSVTALWTPFLLNVMWGR